MKKLFTLALSIVFSSVVFMTTTGPAFAAGSDKSADKSSKRVCKKYRPTGTRIAKKTCMSQRQWDELKRRAQEAARTSQRLSGHQGAENPLHPGSGQGSQRQ